MNEIDSYNSTNKLSFLNRRKLSASFEHRTLYFKTQEMARKEQSNNVIQIIIILFFAIMNLAYSAKDKYHFMCKFSIGEGAYQEFNNCN